MPFLDRERECLEGRAARAREGAGALSFQTPFSSQAPTSLDYSEQWGRRHGESLNCREGKDQIRSGEARRKAAEGELGRGVRGPTCSGACRRGAMGFPGELGKPSQLDSGFPPASGLGCCKRHGFPLGPKAHSPTRRLSPPSPTVPDWVSGCRAELMGQKELTVERRGLSHGLGQQESPVSNTQHMADFS